VSTLASSPPGPVSGSPPATAEIFDLRHPRLRWWLLWLAVFYGVWLGLNAGLDLWQETRDHWPIALAMTLGSFVAGSTPMGGGTVGFPILVLLFDQPAGLGRNFGFVIQSIGMTSASIFILCRRTPIEGRILLWSMAGSASGLLAGTFLVVPFIPDALVKLIFACVWMSFGLLTLARNRELCGQHHVPRVAPAVARNVGLLVGLAGGVTASLTGVGIDMILYCVLVLLFRADLKVAIPTSVIVMAATSLMGVALHAAIGDLTHELFLHWLAAAPVVILGAPFGAFLVSVLPRVQSLYFVAALCVVQFAWTLHQVRPTPLEWLFVASNLLLAGAALAVLYRLGRSRSWG
jgi:uncharacterized protein